MKNIYTITDYVGRKEVINTKHIERLIFADASETKMMGDHSGSYYERKYGISIHLSSGSAVILKFKDEEEALAEYNTLLEMMIQ